MKYVNPRDVTQNWDTREAFEASAYKPVNVTILSDAQWQDVVARYKLLEIYL